MMGPTHRLFGAACGASAAVVAGEPQVMVLMSGLVASATAHGWSSPDVDQTGPWVAVRRALPGVGRWMGHRTGVTHWWVVPVALWLLVEVFAPAQATWPARALIIGWASHLVGDAIFGRIPLWPAGPMIGLGFRTDGFLESGKLWGHRLLPVSPARIALTAWLAWLAAPLLPDGATTQLTSLLPALLA